MDKINRFPSLAPLVPTQTRLAPRVRVFFLHLHLSTDPSTKSALCPANYLPEQQALCLTATFTQLMTLHKHELPLVSSRI